MSQQHKPPEAPLAPTFQPATWAVMFTVFLFAFLVILGCAIGGAYLVAEHAVHVAQASNLQAGIRTCEAVRKMDEASQPPVVNASSNPLSYGHKLASAIHQLYITSGCKELLSGKSTKPGV
jgi:hypothetical protein